MSQTEQNGLEGASDTDKTKVFISYSRRDAGDFADELVAGLELAGFAPFLDRHDIAAGEDWEARLGGLIEQADTVVFVVSPEAVKSERCVWEVDKALALSKRLLPVTFKPVPDADIPENLRRLQFVRFDTGRGVARPLAELAAALRVDLEWIREHTRLGELAVRWQARGRPGSLLLRDDVDAAKAWMARRKAEAPPISDLHRAFINASNEAEDLERERGRRLRRKTLSIWAVVGALVASIVAGFGAWRNEQWLKEHIYWLANVRGYVLTAVQEGALKPKDAFKECSACPEMVVVPAGSFLMGSVNFDGGLSDERPQHRVTIARRFAIARFELTFDEWDACAAHGDCDTRVSAGSWGRGRQPVINVSWDDAQRYLAWLSRLTGQPYRLLTEAEWEYAARAGDSTRYSWGNGIGKGNANCASCGSQWDKKQPGPAGSFAANAFGLHDMHGNVWEWVEDTWHGNYNGAPTDGSAWLEGGDSRRVARGGSWLDHPELLRSTARLRDSSVNRYNYLGFRAGRTLGP
jgi:formylglycine-generating enzyme required for sulfatase activity